MIVDQRTYLKRFSCVLRWRLSKAEADEILDDYQEIFSQRSKEEDDLLIQEFGEPLQAARLLTDHKIYHHWLVVFGLMVVCLLLSEVMLLHATQYSMPMMITPFIIGLVIDSIWFRPCKKERERSIFPKGLLPIFISFIMVIVVDIVILGDFLTQYWNFLPNSLCGMVAYWALEFTGVIATMIGILGLVKARISDRRWSILYLMALMVLIQCVMILAILTNMDLNVVSSHQWVSSIIQLGIISLIGFVGVVVNLC